MNLIFVAEPCVAEFGIGRVNSSHRARHPSALSTHSLIASAALALVNLLCCVAPLSADTPSRARPLHALFACLVCRASGTKLLRGPAIGRNVFACAPAPRPLSMLGIQRLRRAGGVGTISTGEENKKVDVELACECDKPTAPAKDTSCKRASEHHPSSVVLRPIHNAARMGA